jgi:hypothetical protein
MVALELKVDLGSAKYNKYTKCLSILSEFQENTDINCQCEEILTVWDSLGKFNPLHSSDMALPTGMTPMAV